MTINELLAGGVVLQSVGLVTHEEINGNGESVEHVLFDGAVTWGGRKVALDLSSPIPGEWGWGDRRVRHIYPLPGTAGSRPCPILAVEVE